METITPVEQQASIKIPAKDVWAGFESFEKASQQGFDTAEDRLRSYGQFMAKVADFFDQPQLLDSPTPEQRDLVRRLFYAHQTTAKVPIDFFVDARKRLEKEVLQKRYVRPAGKKWQDEIDFIRQLTKAEVQKTALELGTEINDRRKLESLAQETPDASNAAVSLDIKSEDEMRHQIQERAVNLLAKDPELAQDVAQRNDYVRTLRTLLSEYDPTKVEEVLAGYKTYLEKPGEPSVVDEVGRRLFLNQHDKVKEIIQEAIGEAQQPDFMWRLWVDKGNIPPQLLDSFEEVMTLSRLAETVKQTSGMPKEARARQILPFVNHGISSTMISEIVEGKYELPDDFIYRQIDAFIHFNDVYQEVKKSPITLKRKLMTAALAALVVTAIPDTALIEQGKSTSEEIQELMEQLSSSEIEELQKLGAVFQRAQDLEAPKETPPVPVQTGDQKTETQTPAYTIEWEYAKPVNDTPEGMLEAQKIKAWELSGENLWGFYRSSSSSELRPRGSSYEWFINRQFSPNEASIFSRKKDMTMSANVTVNNSLIVEIPVLYGHAPTRDGIRFLGEKLLNPGLLQTTDGSYFLYFYSVDKGKNITVSIDLGKSEVSTIPAPSARELQEMTRQLMDTNSMPDDVKKFLQELSQRKDLSQGVKAKILEKYVQKTFLYSLVPQWSNYYHSARNMNEFFRRIMEIKKTDCDVTNTTLVALLRSQNIPARIVFGYAHTGTLSSNQKYLNGAEGHGWTEVYIDGKWIQLDGTPDQMDDFTKKALEGKLSPSQLEGLASFSPLLDLKEGRKELSEEQLRDLKNKELTAIEAMIFAESVKAFHVEQPELALWLDGILLNLGAAGLSVLSRRRSNKLAGKLRQTLDRRVSEYGDWPGRQTAFEKEARKIGELRADYPNPFSTIPPFVQFRAAGDISRRRGLNAIESAYSKGAKVSSSSPNEFEFLTKVLGYKETDVRRKMYERAYNETLDKLARADFQNDGFDALNDQGQRIYGDFRWDQIQKVLGNLEGPQDTAAWEELKRKTKEQLFAQYSGFVDERIARDKAKVKPGTEYTEPGRLTEKDFGDIIDTLLRIQAAKWIAKDSYDAAIASLGQS